MELQHFPSLGDVVIRLFSSAIAKNFDSIADAAWITSTHSSQANKGSKVGQPIVLGDYAVNEMMTQPDWVSYHSFGHDCLKLPEIRDEFVGEPANLAIIALGSSQV
ncbi:MAG: hypothetical protein AAFY67_24330 [Cyanobacteria bacterium J06642_9]